MGIVFQENMPGEYAFRKLVNASHNYKEAAGNNISLLSYHQCNDKEGGIGDLIGYEIEEKNEAETKRRKRNALLSCQRKV